MILRMPGSERDRFLKNWGYNMKSNARTPVEKTLRLMNAARDMFDTLEGIANADWRERDEGLNSPEEFVTWARSRAAQAVARAKGD